ncbi:hypothetical protein [Parerythrobacter jejuensis]|uniref:Uncharacterized protein n=1 Tax=Parerythrobacter jejuensis TaxID=795812 RepID=A0A845AUJ0_9SPHN|nr:hypothetical protein [Parerythrobacter jejuensis]MXP31260.1 hypothetical protein [Parerythrobacter jejuensis]MXP34020.1 hypothetical protein [Parerythrobacter jejuensis]
MPALKLNKTVTQKSPTLAVTNKFKPGTYRFRLSVIDDAQNESAPTEIVVTVIKPTAPIRVNERIAERLRIRDPRRRRINVPPIRDGIIRR